MKGLLPIPSDTIIGLYHPFRDLYSKTNPNGIAYKNFLITDPVRQEYPWRYLAIDQLEHLVLPLWNPYSFSGTPLLGNMQSAPLYPLNILFIILPFSYAWTVLILLQPLLAGIFIFLYLRNRNISLLGSSLGSLSFSFSGFFVAWLEWGTILHTALWLPLLLLCIDKIFINKHRNTILLWSSVFIFSYISSFLAGHLQTFFYESIFILAYTLYHWWEKKSLRKTLPILASFLVIILVTTIQWIPLFTFINESARSVDQSDWHKIGWFIPWQHLIQFIIPDFFGNPATLNYWGIWNYGEFIGYVGILPLLMALIAVFFIRNRIVIFYTAILVVSFLFALPTPLAMLPFSLQIPLLSTAQPTRLLFLIDFSLAILCAYGVDQYLKNPKKVFSAVLLLFVIFIGVWSSLVIGTKMFSLFPEQIVVIKRNIIFPSIIFIATILLLLIGVFVKKEKILIFLFIVCIMIASIDLLRFAWKFTPFTQVAYLFPQTNTIEFLQKNIGNNRFMTTDSQILPPNFSVMYKLQSIEGYDPLYIRTYGEFIAAMQRGKPDIRPPFGFNRIITPHDPNSPFIDLLGVKYVLSLSDITSNHLTKVFHEGETRVYENKTVLPRAFFVQRIEHATTKQDAINKLFKSKNDLDKAAVVEGETNFSKNVFSIGKVKIMRYSSNDIVIETTTDAESFLVLSDIYYPTWKAISIDKEKQGIKKSLPIYRTDYTFRGVIVPAGKQIIEFYNTIL